MYLTDPRRSTHRSRRSPHSFSATVHATGPAHRQEEMVTSMEEIIETKAATHVSGRNVIGIDHAGQLAARRRLREDAAHDGLIMQTLYGGGGVAMWPAGSKTPMAIECEGERNSKIRARQCTRNEQVFTAMAADGRASATREQQVCRQNPSHVNRLGPVVRLCWLWLWLWYERPSA